MIKRYTVKGWKATQIFTAWRYAGAVSVCPSVRPSVRSRGSIKTLNRQRCAKSPATNKNSRNDGKMLGTFRWHSCQDVFYKLMKYVPETTNAEIIEDKNSRWNKYDKKRLFQKTAKPSWFTSVYSVAVIVCLYVVFLGICKWLFALYVQWFVH